MQGSYFNNGYNAMKQYVVQSGDSLYMIAKANNTSVDKLKEVNHLYSNMIYPNQILFIPSNSTEATTSKNNTYVTSSGDSLKDILKKFNLNLDDLSNFNDIDRLKLEGNQLLLIEKRNSEKTKTVEYADKIEDILAKYQLSPLEFLKLNESIILKPGESIIVEK